MKRIIGVLVSLSLFFTSCSSDSSVSKRRKWMRANGKLKVLCTIAMIEDIVKQIGGEHIETLTLIDGQLDPHTYQLVKGDNEKLQAADIIFYNGLGLEHGPSLREYLKKSKKSVGLGDKIAQKNQDLIIKVNGAVDPHIWMDVLMWMKTVPIIVGVLAKYDKKHAIEFRDRAEVVLNKMRTVHGRILQKMHNIPEEKRYLVTSHDAFNYFGRRYLATPREKGSSLWEKRVVAPEGLAPESQLSSTDIQEIISHLREHCISVIFPESNVSRDSLKKIVYAGREKGINVILAKDPLYADAMGPLGSEADTYLKMISYNAKTIYKYLMQEKEGSLLQN